MELWREPDCPYFKVETDDGLVQARCQASSCLMCMARDITR
jgi:hypothetical protein